MRVLVVDSKPETIVELAVEVRAARSDRFEVLVAQDLSSAIKHIVAGGIEVVLLDPALPDADGLEALVRLKRIAPALPIVIATARADDGLAISAVKEGAQDCLVKGRINAEVVARALRYAVERKRAEENARRLMREQLARLQAEAAHRTSHFLAEASRVLSSSLDYEATLKTVAELTVPALADACSIKLVHESGHLRCVATAPERHDPPTAEAAHTSLDDEATTQVLRTSAPVLRTVDASVLGGEARRGRSCIELVVPLTAPGRVLGTMHLLRADVTRPYKEKELTVVEELGRRAALAIDNARLYAAERAARAVAEAAQREATEAAGLREKVLSVVSHDLRGPLQSIMLNTQVIRDAVDGPSVSRAVLIEGLVRIDKATARMTSLVNEMLDVACLQAGRDLELEMQSTDLVALVAQVVADARQASPRRTIRLQTDVHTLVGAWDAARVERAVANLLSNAIKYSGDDRPVMVRIHEEYAGDQRCAVLEVEDRGMGIPEDDLPHLFEWFRRGKNVAGVVPGTGVGLASTKQIIQQHRGSIAVVSRQGVGSRFEVRLPTEPRSERLTAPLR